MNEAPYRSAKEAQDRQATTKALGALQAEVKSQGAKIETVLSHVVAQTYFGVRSPLPMLALAFASASLFGVMVLGAAFVYTVLRPPSNPQPYQTTAKL